jgi:type III secretion system HrpB4-like protein
MPDSPASRVAAALGAWERNAREAFSWAHPSWIAGALAIGEDEAEMLARELRSEAVSIAFLHGARVPQPDLDALAQAGIARLDALPIETGLQVLRLRALRFRRGEIRRIIDKRTRVTVQQWAGVTLEQLTQDTPEERMHAPDIARLALTPIAMLDADALALEGYGLIARDTLSTCPLLRLALPRASNRARWTDTLPREVDAQGTHMLIARLPEFLPEWSWLFG